jgi:regulatory protein
MSVEPETPKKKYIVPIKNKLMDYLARRDHSELELKRKLKKNYEPQEIEEALEWARQNKWLPEPENISVKVADTLHRKYKGIHYINQYLREKGLPTVGRNDEVELEKARHLIKNKASSVRRRADKQKMIRFLVSRGFDSEIIRKVIHEEL